MAVFAGWPKKRLPIRRSFGSAEHHGVPRFDARHAVQRAKFARLIFGLAEVVAGVRQRFVNADRIRRERGSLSQNGERVI
jgi:hypothetical protein